MRKHKSDLVILFMTFILMAIGLIIIYAIGPMRANVLNSAYGGNYDSNYFFIHQLISVGVALVALLIGFKLPYEKMRKLAKWVLIIGLILSILLWILAEVGSSLAKCELGECRWFNLGSVSFQPAEVLKIGMIFYLADFLARKRKEGTVGVGKDFWIPFLIVSGLALGLVVVAQGDLGTGVSLMAIIFGMLWVAEAPKKNYWIFIAIIVIIGVVAVATSGHRMQRVEAWWTTLTSGESSDLTYHIDNAMLAIGMGGFFGVGIGNSVQATGYLPESINDSIFAVLGETFGFFGLMVILGIFTVMFGRMLKVAEKTEDLEQRLIVVGVFSWMLAQTAVNIMAMTGLVPVTGVTLPLMSYGGTSMAFVGFAIGLVLQFSCYTGREVIQHENNNSRRRVGRTYNSSSRRRS